MRAGKPRSYVVVQERYQSQDSFGQPVENWATLFAGFGSVEQLRGREFFSAARVAADVDTRVMLRYRQGIKTEQRILTDGRTLDIKRVLMDEKKTSLELLCKEAG